MTTDPIDLEALRAALDDMGYARTVLECEGNFTPAECLEDAQRVVSEALAELTTRRARDAEVAELVAAVRGATEERWHNGASSKEACDRLVAALLPFQRSDDKGDSPC